MSARAGRGIARAGLGIAHFVWVGGIAVGAVGPTEAAGQQPSDPAVQVAPVAPIAGARPAIDVSPRGAFLRALAIPGWGHAAIGAHTRGGFYFAVEAATAYTFLRSRRRLQEARERLDFRETFLRDQLAIEGVVDLEEIDARLEADPAVAELRRLEDSRADQQEDMIALGIFVLFLSGADAYVSAHLSRFPAPLELGAAPMGDGRMQLSLSVPLPR